MNHNFKQYFIADLLLDAKYPSDRARARKLAEVMGIKNVTAQTQVQRARHYGMIPRRQKAGLLSPRRHPDVPHKHESFYIYCIECITPNHFYIGQSGNIAERLRSHERGNTPFMREHGISRYYIVAQAFSRLDALRIEYLLYTALKQRGVITGGMGYKESNDLMTQYRTTLGY